MSLCVLSDDWDGPYVHVDGRAEVLDMPDALDGLVDYYRGIARQPRRTHETAPASGSRLLTSTYRTREHRETACRSFP